MPHFEKLRKMERDVGALGTIGFLFDRGGARNGQSRPCGNRGPSMNCLLPNIPRGSKCPSELVSAF
jgi:hypothetical protein